MNKTEYENQRKTLMNEATELIDSDQLEAADKKMSEVDALDKKWSAEAEAYANLEALSDDPMQDISEDQQDAIRQMMSGSVMNMGSGKVYNTGRINRDPMYLNGNNTMVNYAVNHGADVNPVLMNDDSLADIVRGVTLGKWSSKELRDEVITTGQTGAIIPSVLSAKVIDLARDLSLFMSANVPTTPMESGNLKIGRIKQGPKFSFKPEGQKGAELDADIDSIDLKSKTCYGFCYVSLEAVESSQNLTSILNQLFAQAISEAVDNAMLYGMTDESGALVDYAPEGVLNCPDIITLDAVEGSGYDDIVRGVSAIRQKNYIPTCWSINSYTDEMLNLLKDNEGRYLGAPESLSGLKKIVSNQLNFDEVNGSDALIFAPDAMIIGIQNDVRIKMIEDSECLQNGLIGFQVFCMLDCAVTTPDAICRIKGLK